MTRFESDWLALRAAADSRARSSVLERLLAGVLPEGEPLRVVDLGCGTGSNLRHLAPRLGRRSQHWSLIDSDADLLAALPGAMTGWATEQGWETAADGDTVRLHGDGLEIQAAVIHADLLSEPLPVATPPNLVTAAAIFDLVSGDWLERLAAGCRAAGAAALFALTYDGRIAWEPPDPLDDSVRTLVNRHQRGDKGFGPALGPEAAPLAGEIFTAEGFAVQAAASDWELGPEEVALQQYLHAGWAAAASATDPARADAIGAWLERRIDLLTAGTSRVSVGHRDLLAVPAAE